MNNKSDIWVVPNPQIIIASLSIIRCSESIIASVVRVNGARFISHNMFSFCSNNSVNTVMDNFVSLSLNISKTRCNLMDNIVFCIISRIYVILDVINWTIPGVADTSLISIFNILKLLTFFNALIIYNYTR